MITLCDGFVCENVLDILCHEYTKNSDRILDAHNYFKCSVCGTCKRINSLWFACKCLTRHSSRLFKYTDFMMLSLFYHRNSLSVCFGFVWLSHTFHCTSHTDSIRSITFDLVNHQYFTETGATCCSAHSIAIACMCEYEWYHFCITSSFARFLCIPFPRSRHTRCLIPISSILFRFRKQNIQTKAFVFVQFTNKLCIW